MTSLSSVKYLFLLVIVAVCINAGLCIKCYNCISRDNKECLDPRSHSGLVPQECSGDLLKNLSKQVQTYASSIGAAIGIDLDAKTKQINDIFVCQKIETTVNNDKLIIRGCQMSDTVDLSSCKAVEKQVGGIVSHCSICNEDGCNSGRWLAPLSLATILLPAISLALSAILF